MSDTVLPEGTHSCEFKGIALHANLVAFSDTRLGRIAVHEFERRDGAQTEDMGTAPHIFRGTLYFVDTDGFAAARAFVASLDEGRTGLLVHPIYGRMRATCKGIENASLDVQQGANAYQIPNVEFIQAELDARVVVDAAQGVTAKAQAVTALATATTTAAAPFPAAAPAISALTGAATAFAAAAAAASTGGAALDRSLDQQIQSVATRAADAAVAVMAAAGGDPSAYVAIAVIEGLLAACADVGSALLSARPPLEDYPVLAETPLVVIAAERYGANAAARLPEILANNPDLRTPNAVPAGFPLKLAAV